MLCVRVISSPTDLNNHTVMMLHENKKLIILLALLFLIMGIHFALSSWYTYNYNYAKNGHHDLYWQSISYKITLLGILGEIGLAASKNIILKVVSFLCIIPSIIFSLFIIRLFQSDGHSYLLPIKSYYDYLSIIPFIVNAVVISVLFYLVYHSLSKDFFSIPKEQ